MVKVHGAQPNDWTVGSLPIKYGKLYGYLGICLKLQTGGPRSFLVLVNHQRTNAAHTVIAKMPLSTLSIGGAREGHSTQNQQISAPVQKALDCGPCFFRKSRAIGEHQEATRRRHKNCAKVICIG